MSQTDYRFTKFYNKWALYSSILNLFGLSIVWIYGNAFPWVLFTTCSFGIYIYRIPKYIGSLSAWIGYANWVSISRFILVILLFAFHHSLSATFLFGFFLISICLDGLDGYLARRFKHISDVGGKLDMEIDAFMVLAISWIHVEEQNLHWWILVPGSLRYLYEIISFWVKKDGKELMSKKYRATIAVIFFLALLIPFLTQSPSLIIVTYISGALIIFSFLVSLFSQIENSK
ncbi:MAG: CDP-alcohol phosphatidyltransferase family protein [Cyclobacteriaceae bacterium]